MVDRSARRRLIEGGTERPHALNSTVRGGSLRTVGLVGLTIGVAFGGVFGLAVVSFADCPRPDCSYQRIFGVVAHAAGAGVAGVAASLLVHAFVRLVRQNRDRLR